MKQYTLDYKTYLFAKISDLSLTEITNAISPFASITEEQVIMDRAQLIDICILITDVSEDMLMKAC